jgi:hypothetical protein
MPSKLSLTSGRVLPRDDAEPCSELSSFTEGGSVANRRDDGGGNDRSDPGNLTYPGAAGISRGDPFQLIAELLDLLLDHLPLTPQHVDQVAHLWCEVGFRVLQDVRRGFCANTMPLSSRNARNWLMTAVRREIRRSRTRWIACKSN